MASHHAKRTTDHPTIRAWAEDRGGRPASVRGTGDAGVLRIDFEGPDEEALEPLSWDDFFAKFEEARLALLYQEETEDGAPSRFCKLVARQP